VKRRAATSLLGIAIGALSVASAGHPVLAQGLPASGTGLGDFAANPGMWVTAMFNAALVGLGQKTTGDMVGFMNWVLGTGNLITQTPAGLSYDNPAVQNLWGTTRTVANAGLAVVTVWGGVNLMISPHIRAPYHGALELVPRVLLSGILVNTSLDWGRFVIDLNNALSSKFGSTSIPAWDSVMAGTSPELLNLIAMAIYLFMGLLLLAQMLMRLALLDALLVIGPLALLCWVLPQTYAWARLWFSTFFGTVFVQSIQVLVLQLGAGLIQRLPSLLESMGSSPVDSGRVWLMTLLLGVAVLQLARKVPRLLSPLLGVGTDSGVGSMRQVSTLVKLAAGQNGQKGSR
jgi:hypothetical protein